MSRFDTTLPHRSLPTIEADASVMDAIACMVSFDAPAVVVEDRGRGLGVYTEQDLRALVAARGDDPARTPLRQLLRPTLAATRPAAAAEVEALWTTTRWVEA